VDGTWTIGYGHHMVEGWWKDSISEQFADSLLRVDVDKNVEHIDRMYEYSEDSTLAVSLFTFNCGTGNYNRSRLKRLIDKGLRIDKEIVKWCHYTKNGTIHMNIRFRERREFELKIYNYDFLEKEEEK